MSRARSKAHLRWPADVAQHAQALLDWALSNSDGDIARSPMTAACALILSNLREDINETAAAKPDGRTTMYGVRIAAVDPRTQDYVAASPWSFDVPGMDAVWRYVSENAWYLYDGMDGPPMELGLAELSERTNTARVAMSRRADGVAVIRVRFQWQKKREKRNLRRGAAADDVQVSYEPCDAQINIWIGPNLEAKDMQAKERAAKHALADDEA